METELPQAPPARKKEPSIRAAAKKALSTVTEISDDDEEEEYISDDEDFDLEVVAAPPVGNKKGGGKKPTANAKGGKPPAKKRGPASKQSNVIGQKLITEVLKPAENVGISPEKKVRKMRESPFNKKSGSVLGKVVVGEEENVSTGSQDALASGSEDTGKFVAPSRRPQRMNRGKARYVVSESDEEEEVSQDSDFDEEDD